MKNYIYNPQYKEYNYKINKKKFNGTIVCRCKGRYTMSAKK